MPSRLRKAAFLLVFTGKRVSTPEPPAVF